MRIRVEEAAAAAALSLTRAVAARVLTGEPLPQRGLPWDDSGASAASGDSQGWEVSSTGSSGSCSKLEA